MGVKAQGERIPKGYKQTEVGVIPEEWGVIKLKEKVSFKTGPFGSALHQSDYIDDGIPVINPMQIIDGKIIPTSTMAITEKAAICLSDFRLQTYDIVIGRRGEMGRCAVIDILENGWLCGTGSMIIRCNKSLIDPNYLQRVLSSAPIIAAIENTSVGSTMINLNQSTLGNLSIPLPPLPEQRAIAAALSDADALIDALGRLVAKKRRIKEGAMQELLTGRRRLPGFAGKWERKRLGEVAEIVTGGTPSTIVPDYWGEGYPWVTPSDISDKKDISCSERSLTQDGINQIHMLPRDSVLVTCIASIGKNVILRESGGCNQQINAIVPNAQMIPDFIFYLMELNTDYLIENAGKTATSIISRKVFSNLFFTFPPREEQSAIAAVLSDMDSEIQALEAKLAKARLVKRGMMQELLTGRVRLG